VFCGIARHDRFRASVRDAGLSDTHFRAFTDHHTYSHSDWVALEGARQSSGCGWFLTTAKDAVRIDPAWLGSTPLRFLRIALHQIAGTDILTALAKDG
jgi:tetraacyldisaccharide 4'-kinase